MIEHCSNCIIKTKLYVPNIFRHLTIGIMQETDWSSANDCSDSIITHKYYYLSVRDLNNSTISELRQAVHLRRFQDAYKFRIIDRSLTFPLLLVSSLNEILIMCNKFLREERMFNNKLLSSMFWILEKKYLH